MTLRLCEHRWKASRVELLPVETLPVEHVCWLKADHTVDHQCSCGAITDTDTSRSAVSVNVPDHDNLADQRWFLKADWSPWIEVTMLQWLKAEREAGFRNKSGNPLHPATSGFSGNGVQGRVVYSGTDPKNYAWDKDFSAVAWPEESR